MKKILIVGLVLFMMSCSKDSSPSFTPAEFDPTLEVFTDPFYDQVGPDAHPRDYWDLYKKDSRREGIEGYGEGWTTSIEWSTDNSVELSPDYAGYAVPCAFGTRTPPSVYVRISKDAWDNYSKVRRLILMYHEFGHAYNFYDHSEDVPNGQYPIMYPSLGVHLETTLKDFVEIKSQFFKGSFEGAQYLICGAANPGFVRAKYTQCRH